MVVSNGDTLITLFIAAIIAFAIVNWWEGRK